MCKIESSMRHGKPRPAVIMPRLVLAATTSERRLGEKSCASGRRMCGDKPVETNAEVDVAVADADMAEAPRNGLLLMLGLRLDETLDCEIDTPAAAAEADVSEEADIAAAAVPCTGELPPNGGVCSAAK